MKNLFKNRSGFSFIELMIAIAIIMIISAAFVVNVRLNTQESIETKTEKIASDVRYLRNLAVSRAKYQFVGQTEAEKAYPPGGYGIYFNGNVTQHKYFLYADDGTQVGYQAANDEKLYEVVVHPLKLDDQNSGLNSFYFAFISEHEVSTNMGLSASIKEYTLNLREDVGVYGSGYQGTLVLGEVSSDGYVWSNIGTSYGTFNIPKPYVPPPDEDPQMMQEIDCPRC